MPPAGRGRIDRFERANIWLMVPKTDGGRRIRNVLAKLPLMRAMAAVERVLQPKTALPEYAPAQ